MDPVKLSSDYAAGLTLLVLGMGVITSVVEGFGGDLWGSSTGVLEQLLPVLEERVQNQQ